MNGNVFTDDLRYRLPKSIKDFLNLHKIQMYFKFELTQFYSDGYKYRSTKSRLKSMSPTRLSDLQSNLLSLCNTPLTESDTKKANNADVCKLYYKDDWTARNTLIKNKKSGTKKQMMNINPDYFKDVIKNVFKDFFGNTDYDIILLVSTVDVSLPLKERVIGFLITQMSECQDVDNIYSSIPALNLVCAPKKHRHTGMETKCVSGCSVVGRVLLYMYIYALKKKKIDYGLLELAGLYCNISGLCLYTKFGFVEDISIKSNTCFEEDETLSMVANIKDMNFNKINDALLKGDHILAEKDREPLCSKANIGNSPESKKIAFENQQKQVLQRMKNYRNILKLQQGKISLDDIQDIYFNNNKPKEIKSAIKTLSESSKLGNVLNFTKKRKGKQTVSIQKQPISKLKNIGAPSAGFNFTAKKRILSNFMNLSKKGMRFYKRSSAKYTRKRNRS